MEEKLCKAISELKSVIESDERVKKLHYYNELLNKDLTASELSDKKKNAFQEFLNIRNKTSYQKQDYIDAKTHFDEFNTAFFNLESVKNYQNAYKEVSLLYDYIDSNLFDSFRAK